MRKGILAVVGLLIGLGVILPFISGMMAEKELGHLVTVVSDRTPGVTLTLSNYQRGWFSSTALMRVDIKIPANQRQGMLAVIPPMSFDVTENIQHGPVIFNQHKFFIGQALMSAQIVLGPTQQALLSLMFANQDRQPSIQHKLLVKLNGSYMSTTLIPEFTLSTKSKETDFVWLGYDERFNFSRDLTRISGKSVFDGLHFVSPKIRVDIDTIEFSMNKDEGPYGIWVGDVNFTIPTIRISVAKVDKLSVKAINFSAKSSIDDKLLNSIVKVSMEKLNIAGEHYGPARFSSQLKNIDATALNKLEQKIDAIKRANLPESQIKQEMMALIPNALQLFAKGAQIELETLQLTLPEGVVSLNGHAKIVATTGTKIDSIPLLLQHVQAELNAQLPIALAKKSLNLFFENKLRQHQTLQRVLAKQLQQQQAKATSYDATDAQKNKPKIVPLSDQQIQILAEKNTEKQLALWKENGMLLQTGNTYKVAIKYAKGALTINGKLDKNLLASPPAAKQKPVMP